MFDFLRPKILEQVNSSFSGEIKVVKSSGDVYIATGPLTQSGGLVKVVWQDVLKKFGKKDRSWLVLGLAGGTIARFISEKMHPSAMVGVEIDPVMINLGKKYLGLDRIPELEIVNADAKAYVAGTDRKFDYILVDMYLGDKLPQFVYSKSFLSRLGKLGNTIIFNHLFYDDDKRAKAEALIAELKTEFPALVLARKLTNLLIICRSQLS